MLDWLFWLSGAPARGGRYTTGHADKMPSRDVEMLTLAAQYAEDELQEVYGARNSVEIARLDFWEGMRDSMVSMGAAPPTRPVPPQVNTRTPRPVQRTTPGQVVAVVLGIGLFGAACVFCGWLKGELSTQFGRTEWYGRMIALTVFCAIPFWIAYVPFGFAFARRVRYVAMYFAVVWLIAVFVIAAP
jgi:hypothetical protein